MELRGSTSFSWSHSISHHSLHIPHPLAISSRGFSVFCSFDETQKKNKLTVSITGATGFIGRRLVQRLHADSHNIRVLTRSRSKAEVIFPDREFPGIVIAEEPGWKDCIQGSDGVVNLAGMPISTRWSAEIKKEIKQSRVTTTSKVVSLINDAPDAARPKVLVSATAVGYYGSSETAVFDEQSPSGNDYLAEVLSMEQHPILLNWRNCVNNWDMPWAGLRGFRYQTLPCKRSSEKGPVWFWKGNEWFLPKPKNWGFLSSTHQ